MLPATFLYPAEYVGPVLLQRNDDRRLLSTELPHSEWTPDDFAGAIASVRVARAKLDDELAWLLTVAPPQPGPNE
ncbi:MAG: hypothetical protein ACREQ5_25695 [Candidatus Dormibacteria bacterium]